MTRLQRSSQIVLLCAAALTAPVWAEDSGSSLQQEIEAEKNRIKADKARQDAEAAQRQVEKANAEAEARREALLRKQQQQQAAKAKREAELRDAQRREDQRRTAEADAKAAEVHRLQQEEQARRKEQQAKAEEAKRREQREAEKRQQAVAKLRRNNASKEVDQADGTAAEAPKVDVVTPTRPTSTGCDYCPEMVEIPGGSFMMGAPDSEAKSDDNERPRHRVTLQGFALGKYEVTQGQWRAVMGGNPSFFSACGDSCPVEQVSFDKVQQYIARLNQKTGGHYRLPSEAEWEYAARAGTTTPFSTGVCINTAQANYNGNYDYNGCGAKTGVYWQKTQPVGSYPAIRGLPWDLRDMHGNVWEWVQDCYHDSYQAAPADGSAWDDGANCASGRRVLRGGSWFNNPGILRSAYRIRNNTDYRNYDFGFRLARTLTP